MPPPNNVFQPTRCASLALEDQWHFGASTNLSMLYPRSERLNTSRWAAIHVYAVLCLSGYLLYRLG
jgi:hypothetical protein